MPPPRTATVVKRRQRPSSPQQTYYDSTRKRKNRHTVGLLGARCNRSHSRGRESALRNRFEKGPLRARVESAPPDDESLGFRPNLYHKSGITRSIFVDCDQKLDRGAPQPNLLLAKLPVHKLLHILVFSFHIMFRLILQSPSRGRLFALSSKCRALMEVLTKNGLWRHLPGTL